MRFRRCASRRYAQFEGLSAAGGLVHAFSTRPLDVSPRPGARDEERAAHRRQMAVDLGADPAKLCHCDQVHGDRIARVDGDTPPGPLRGADAVVTAAPARPVLTFSADCPLVLLFDPVRGVLALVHASWRCTVARLVMQVVARLRREYGCDPADLRAGIGPGAGPCCYEVGLEVYVAAADLPDREALFARRDGRLYFDLWRANRAQLHAAGVCAARVETAGVCTICGGGLFYSYRREGPGCGHFGLMAMLTAG